MRFDWTSNYTYSTDWLEKMYMYCDAQAHIYKHIQSTHKPRFNGYIEPKLIGWICSRIENIISIQSAIQVDEIDVQ